MGLPADVRLHQPLVCVDVVVVKKVGLQPRLGPVGRGQSQDHRGNGVGRSERPRFGAFEPQSTFLVVCSQ